MFCKRKVIFGKIPKSQKCSLFSLILVEKQLRFWAKSNICNNVFRPASV